MSIQSMSVLVDGVVVTTGGVATTGLTKGISPQKLSVILDDSSEFTAQTQLDFSVKDPRVSTGAPNGYTQAVSQVKILVPLALDNLGRTVNTVTVKLSVDHETSAAEIASLKILAAQVIADSDFTDFWEKQVLS